jgi:hypothetical protein
MKDLLPYKEAIFEVGLLFSKSTQPSEAQVNAYAKALQNYTPKQIVFAFNQVILTGSAFFPSLAEILAHLKVKEVSKDEKANAVVAELFQAIKDFSQYSELEMVEALSEDARLTLLAMGGTSELRNTPIDNIGTTRAQLRDLAKSVIASKDNATKAAKLERIGIKTGIVLDFKKSNHQPMMADFSGYLPENPA